jgi:hypothetical protein
MNNNLIEEIHRINELMLVTSSPKNQKTLIKESIIGPIFQRLFKLGVATIDDLGEYVFKQGKIPNEIKGKSLSELSEDEVKILMKGLDPFEFAQF